MIRHHEIRRAGKRAVKVERRCAARAEQVRRGVLARIAANDAAADPFARMCEGAVAHALGLDDVALGGVMTGARAREIRASDGVEKRDIVVPAPGRPLLAEISDLFRRSPERCPKPLYETRV